ncbi:MAG: hypothetical protein DSM106950_07050 [Stigonema ocellatum SAG 48.90 = DSM 106950]|nr:hypothetical protein [Stigonema ocellatum SAG 48.90 = DSM 106950]
MNYRIIVFSAIMTAMAGAVISLSALQMGNKDFNQPKYQSQSYKDLREHYTHIGTFLGFTLGAGLECVRQLKSKRE